MKKIITILLSFLFISFQSAKAEMGVGITGALHMLDASGTETTKHSSEKNNGSHEEDAAVLELFAEAMNFVDVTGTDDADYLKNKLSTLTLSTAAQGGGSASGGLDSRTYDIAITGGNITIANNITFLTPETLGVVDKSIGSFTGSRSITGSLTCYLYALNGSLLNHSLQIA